VNLIGEHTDYNEGFVLPFAIGARTTVAAGRRADGVLAVASAQFPAEVATVPLADIAPGTVTGWLAYPAGVAWALGGAVHEGVSLFIDSDVPAGSGLSSSAALECAAGVALNDLWDLGADRGELARACRSGENEVVGAPTGIMDQFASLFGEHGSAVLIDCRTVTGENVPLPLEGAGLEIVLADTREQHAHAAGGYVERRASCDRAARILGVPALRDVGPDDLDQASQVLDRETFRRVRHVVTEDERVLAAVASLRAGGLASDPAVLGALLTASHASMRDDFEVSAPSVDLLVEIATADPDVYGARMTGGGFGGCVIALAALDKADRIADAIRDAVGAAGYNPPTITGTRAGQGAELLR
jgi:galactokinase